MMVPCKFHLMAYRILLGATFAFLIPLGSTDPLLANVSVLSHHQKGKLKMISVVVVADSMHATGPFLDRARVEAYGGSGVAMVQFTKLGDVSHVPHEQGRPPFEIGHPGGIDERVRVIHFTARRSRKLISPNENQVGQICLLETLFVY